MLCADTVALGKVELENAADDAAPAEDGETEGLKKVTQTLNSSDKLYHEVRDMYFMNLGPNLTKIGMDIKRTYEERGAHQHRHSTNTAPTLHWHSTTWH